MRLAVPALRISGVQDGARVIVAFRKGVGRVGGRRGSAGTWNCLFPVPLHAEGMCRQSAGVRAPRRAPDRKAGLARFIGQSPRWSCGTGATGPTCRLAPGAALSPCGRGPMAASAPKAPHRIGATASRTRVSSSCRRRGRRPERRRNGGSRTRPGGCRHEDGPGAAIKTQCRFLAGSGLGLAASRRNVSGRNLAVGFRARFGGRTPRLEPARRYLA